MSLSLTQFSIFRWHMLRGVSRSLVLAIDPEALRDLEMDTKSIKEQGICPLSVIEHLLRDITLLQYVTFVVWLDKTYPLEESWNWYRKIHKTFGFCLPTIRVLILRRVYLWFADKFRRA